MKEFISAGFSPEDMASTNLANLIRGMKVLKPLGNADDLYDGS